MKKKVLRVLAAVTCTTMALGLTGCANNEKSDSQNNSSSVVSNNVKEITIKRGESYKFSDIAPEDVDLSWTYRSDDNSIAEVRSDKYIMGYSAGTTKVYINAGNGEEVYKVTVTEREDESRLLKVPDIKDVSVYLGSGYNAFTSSGAISINQIKTSKVLIKPRAINELVADDENALIVDKNVYNNFFQIMGSNVSNYEDNYVNEIQGAFDLDLKGIVGVGVSGKFRDATGTNSKTKSVYNTIMSVNQRYQYILNADTEELAELAQQNKTAWKKLTNSNGKTSAEDFFNEYGTHIVTSSLIGGRVELDYVLSSNDTNKNEEDLLDISGKINVNLAAIKADATGKYVQESNKIVNDNKLTVKTTIKTYGGEPNAATVFTDLDSFGKGYATWYGGLSENNCTFIGTSDDGLLPVWELLDEDEYPERIKELQNYYNQKMKKE